MADYSIEADVEKQIVAYCEKRGWLCLKLVLLSLVGFPDRTVVTHTGVVFIEVKRQRGGKLSKQQEYWLRKLSSMGGCQAACINSFESFLEIMQAHQ